MTTLFNLTGQIFGKNLLGDALDMELQKHIVEITSLHLGTIVPEIYTGADKENIRQQVNAIWNADTSECIKKYKLIKIIFPQGNWNEDDVYHDEPGYESEPNDESYMDCIIVFQNIEKNDEIAYKYETKVMKDNISKDGKIYTSDWIDLCSTYYFQIKNQIYLKNVK